MRRATRVRDWSVRADDAHVAHQRPMLIRTKRCDVARIMSFIHADVRTKHGSFQSRILSLLSTSPLYSITHDDDDADESVDLSIVPELTSESEPSSEELERKITSRFSGVP